MSQFRLLEIPTIIQKAPKSYAVALVSHFLALKRGFNLEQYAFRWKNHTIRKSFITLGTSLFFSNRVTGKEIFEADFHEKEEKISSRL